MFLLSSTLCNTISRIHRRGAGTVSLREMGEMKEQCLLYPQEGTAHCIMGGRL